MYAAAVSAPAPRPRSVTSVWAVPFPQIPNVTVATATATAVCTFAFQLLKSWEEGRMQISLPPRVCNLMNHRSENDRISE